MATASKVTEVQMALYRLEHQVTDPLAAGGLGDFSKLRAAEDPLTCLKDRLAVWEPSQLLTNLDGSKGCKPP
jgi:hypothetical protein